MLDEVLVGVAILKMPKLAPTSRVTMFKYSSEKNLKSFDYVHATRYKELSGGNLQWKKKPKKTFVALAGIKQNSTNPTSSGLNRDTDKLPNIILDTPPFRLMLTDYLQTKSGRKNKRREKKSPIKSFALYNKWLQKTNFPGHFLDSFSLFLRITFLEGAREI